jgi:hypothetical protein
MTKGHRLHKGHMTKGHSLLVSTEKGLEKGERK